MTESKVICMKCGSSNEMQGRYCSSCGSSLVFQNKLSKKRFRITWRWVFFSFIAIFIFEYIFATIASQMFLMFTGAEFMPVETGIVVSSAGSIAGIFLGSLYSSYMSPGITIKEPVFGAAAEIIISQAILMVLAGTFTPIILLGTAIRMAIALGGAKTGELIQKKLR